MEDAPDFNIDNYGLEELLTIFGIESPIKKEAIMNIAKKFIDKYKDLGKSEYAEFFSKGMNRLLSNYEMVEGILGKVEDFIENVEKKDFDPSIITPNRNDNINVLDKGVGDHAPQFQKRLLVPNTYSQIPFAQGHINPTLQNEYNTWLNIDSQYREIIPTETQISACNIVNNTLPEITDIKQEDSSTDFTFSLATPVTNVLAMSLGTIEVPLSGYYNFSDTYGNTTFEVIVDKETHCLRIPEGNYNSTNLKSAVKALFEENINNSNNNSNIKLEIDEANQKAYFYTKSPSPPSITFNWGDKSCCGICNECCDLNKKSSNDLIPKKYLCSDKNKGKKLNSTFGWTLGFRQYKTSLKSYTIDANTNPIPTLPDINGSVHLAVGSSVVNLHGSRYFILEVDDFNRNRNNGEMATMSMPSLTEGFTLPSYAKELSQIYPICDISNLEQKILPAGHEPPTTTPINIKIQNEKITRQSRKGTPAENEAIKGHDTLTKAQKYTAIEIRNSQIKPNTNQYFSPQASNILYRFPVQRNSNVQQPLVVENTSGFDNARKYFGPVTIEKLRVRLLDDKGYPVDLHNENISLSLLLKRLYQY